METSKKKRCQFCGVGMLANSHKCVVCNEIQHSPEIVERRLNSIYFGQEKAAFAIWYLFFASVLIGSINVETDKIQLAPILGIALLAWLSLLYFRFCEKEYKKIISSKSIPILLQEISERRTKSIMTQFSCYSLSIGLVIFSVHLFRTVPSHQDFEAFLTENTCLTTEDILDESRTLLTHSYLLDKEGTYKFYMGIGNNFFELEPKHMKKKEQHNFLKLWK